MCSPLPIETFLGTITLGIFLDGLEKAFYSFKKPCIVAFNTFTEWLFMGKSVLLSLQGFAAHVSQGREASASPRSLLEM